MSDQIENLKPEDVSIGDRPLSIPSELPILPLRDTVLFPNSFMPLAVARESSVRLIDDAIANGKLIAVFTQRDAAVEEPGQDDLYRVGTATHIHKMFKLPDGSLRLIVQGLARLTLDEVVSTQPYLRARVSAAAEDTNDADRLEIDALARNIKTNFQQVVSLSPLLSDDLQTLAMNITEPGRLADFIASSLSTISTAGQAGGARDARHPRAHGQPEPDPDQGARGARARLEDPVAGAVRGRQEPARVLPARADEGDSEGARRGRRPDQGDRGADREDRSGRACPSGEEGSAARARSAVEDAGGGGRIHRVAHLSRLAGRAAVDQADRRSDRSAADQGRARRRSLGPREGEGSHPRIPRRPQAESGRQGADPLLRRPSRRRQDVAGALDRRVARPQVRARVARRHARRGRDPRPPPHLHRRAARPDHPGAAARRVEEPGLHPRRDRQARLRLPRRSLVGAARSARSGAEQHVPRSLSRRAVRSVRGAVHHDGQRARSGSGGAARPDGGARDRRLHRGREAEDRDRSPGRQAGEEPRADRRSTSGSRRTRCAR